jgi:hypothetical protein
MTKNFIDKTGISNSNLNKLKFAGRSCFVVSAALSTHLIATSVDKPREALRQGALITGGVAGALTSAKLSAGPCALTGPVAAPFCVGGATILGGIAGTIAADKAFEAANTVKPASAKSLQTSGIFSNLKNNPLNNGVCKGIEVGLNGTFLKPADQVCSRLGVPPTNRLFLPTVKVGVYHLDSSTIATHGAMMGVIDVHMSNTSLPSSIKETCHIPEVVLHECRPK